MLQTLAEKICGEIVLSENTGETMKKWRQIFLVSQSEIARKLKLSPSVVSDYEAGRRNPGVKFIKKYVSAILEIDSSREQPIALKFRDLFEFDSSAILDIVDYPKSVSLDDFCKAVEAEKLNDFEKNLNGHTIVDSINAILKFKSFDFSKLFGYTTERALIFTKVSTGRSPMVAVRVSNLKPSAVVLHNIQRVDDIAVKIAELEKIPLLTTSLEINKITENLRRAFL